MHHQTAPNFNNRSRSEHSQLRKLQQDINQKNQNKPEEAYDEAPKSNEGDEEDRRLDELEKLRKKQIDYAGLTS